MSDTPEQKPDSRLKKILGWCAASVATGFVGVGVSNYQGPERPVGDHEFSDAPDNSVFNVPMELLIDRAAKGHLKNEIIPLLQQYFVGYKNQEIKAPQGLQEITTALEKDDFLEAMFVWNQYKYTDLRSLPAKEIPNKDPRMPDAFDITVTTERTRNNSHISYALLACYQNQLRELIKENPDSMFDGMQERLNKMSMDSEALKVLNERIEELNNQINNSQNSNQLELNPLQQDLLTANTRRNLILPVVELGGPQSAAGALVEAYQNKDFRTAADIAGALLNLHKQTRTTDEESVPEKGKPLGPEAREFVKHTLQLEAIEGYMKHLSRSVDHSPNSRARP